MLRIPAQSNRFQDLMRGYARGEAFAVKHDVTSLKLEERALKAKIGRRPKVWTTETTLPLIADEVLQGRIAMLSGNPRKAARIFKKAAALQEAHNCCDEPPPWWYPVRRSLAAAYLEAGRYQEAASEAQASLQHSPRDGLALLVLSVAEERLGHIESARQHRDEAARAWSGEAPKSGPCGARSVWILQSLAKSMYQSQSPCSNVTLHLSADLPSLDTQVALLGSITMLGPVLNQIQQSPCIDRARNSQ